MTYFIQKIKAAVNYHSVSYRINDSTAASLSIIGAIGGKFFNLIRLFIFSSNCLFRWFTHDFLYFFSVYGI